MAFFDIDFVATETYYHTVFIEADDETEARRIAEQLADSTDFPCDCVERGSYEGTDVEIADVYQIEPTKWDTVLSKDEVARYTEE